MALIGLVQVDISIFEIILDSCKILILQYIIQDRRVYDVSSY